ncbi:MAG: hypothetical protein KGI06_04130 [Candidatus Micrarchaeota archaeon]|nr:hypothetical protein [Candidatus Micrarchaeota archaeon]
MSLNEIKTLVHKHLDNLITQHHFPSESRNKLMKIRNDLDRANSNDQLNNIRDELAELSEDRERKLTREQRGEVYSPVCWIEDYLKEKST